MESWTVRDIPRQDGKVTAVTGATGGLGFETALELAGAGAEVILAGRNDAKGAAALGRIKARYPTANVRFERVDLASLQSVAEFAERIAAQAPAIDILVNNAGVMALPSRQITVDGFEMQFGTNYLSHFALTAHLLPNLRRAPHPRVVNVSSLAHRRGTIAFNDLQSANYDPWTAYSQSKLAMLMFAFELQRRSDRNNWGLMSNAAHPGWARTDLIANGPASGSRGWMNVVSGIAAPLFQGAAPGALPILFAATSPAAGNGAYYGPDGWRERKGRPATAKVSKAAADKTVAARLWDVSEALTHVSFEAIARAA